MSKTPDGIEVIAQPGRRRRFTAEEKRGQVAEAVAPGSSISLVARRNAISSSLLFRWRRLMEQGELESLGADEPVVPASEAKQLRARVCELERLLGRKTLEVEILREALELARPKNCCCVPTGPDREIPSEAAGRDHGGRPL
jgi:transposase